MHGIKQVTEMFHTTQRTLRYYESMGLIGPIHRSGGFAKVERKYTDDDIEHIALVMRLARYGMPLAELREFLTGRADSYEDVLRHLRDKLEYKIAHDENVLFDLEAEMAARGIR